MDGAIHSAAGPALREECRRLGGCERGEAKVTRGYNLPARWVIHTVGPVWREGSQGEDEVLARCYRSSCSLVEKHKIKTIAFPSISTGAYGFPLDRAVRIALKEIQAALEKHPSIEKVSIVCFDNRTYDSYLRALDEGAETKK